MSTILEERRKIVKRLFGEFLLEIKPYLLRGKRFSKENMDNTFFKEKIEEVLFDKNIVEFYEVSNIFDKKVINTDVFKEISVCYEKMKNKKERNFFGIPLIFLDRLAIKIEKECNVPELRSYRGEYIEEYFSSFDNILKTSLENKEIKNIKNISLKECIEILDKKNIYFYIPDLIYSYNRRKKVKNFKEIEEYFSQMVQKSYGNILKEKSEKVFNLLLSFFEKEVIEKFYHNQFLNRLGLLEDEKTLEKEINTFFKELETKYFEKAEIKPLLETI